MKKKKKKEGEKTEKKVFFFSRLCSVDSPLVILGSSTLPAPEDECRTILQLATTNIEQEVRICLGGDLTIGIHGPPRPRIRGNSGQGANSNRSFLSD